MDYAEKMQRCHEYVEALEQEKRKIQVFQRELPLCLELVTQAIEACKRELSGTTTEYMHGQSECSEQTSSEGPVLEEFIPIKRSSSDVDDDFDDDDEHQSEKPINNRDKNSDIKKKSDWLRSVQLWNQSPDPPTKEDVSKKVEVADLKRNGGAFQPFHRERSVAKTDQVVGKSNSSVMVVDATTSSTAETATGVSGGSSKREEKESQRKQRRCWSPELHRRFLHALQQLGGSHVATPKQIRELMKVDGLTNDEVKSHLQKYRLHTRRPIPAVQNNTNPQAPQFVVVGGIWVPPEYAAVASTTVSGEAPTISPGNRIYAPVAAPMPTIPNSSGLLTKMLQKSVSDNSEGAVHSNSPSPSSSTHTTTTTSSPVF